MYALTVLVSIILLIIILLTIFPLKVVFKYNLEQLTNFHLMLSWLRPLIKGIIKRDENKITLTVYLLNKKILTKDLTNREAKGTNNLKLVKSIKFGYVRLQTSYGFEDPSITGMICGVISLISEYVDLNSSCNNSNFSTDHDYFNINVVAKVNVIVSTLNLLKLKKA